VPQHFPDILLLKAIAPNLYSDEKGFLHGMIKIKIAGKWKPKWRAFGTTDREVAEAKLFALRAELEKEGGEPPPGVASAPLEGQNAALLRVIQDLTAQLTQSQQLIAQAHQELAAARSEIAAVHEKLRRPPVSNFNCRWTILREIPLLTLFRNGSRRIFIRGALHGEDKSALLQEIEAIELCDGSWTCGGRAKPRRDSPQGVMRCVTVSLSMDLF